MRILSITSTWLVLVFSTVSAVAQTSSEAWVTNGFGHFFISVIAGVLLGSKTDKALSAVDQLAPGEADEGKKYREKVEQHLRETGEEESHPDKLKEDLDNILNDPQTTPEVLKSRVSKFDRSTLKSLIRNMDGMDEQKTEKM